MQIQLASNEFWMKPGLQEYVMSKIRFAFSALKRKTINIAVRLCYAKGDARTGRGENMCEISVSMPGQPEVLVKHVQDDMYAAIDMAVERAAHRARRILMCKRSGMLESVRTSVRSKFRMDR